MEKEKEKSNEEEALKPVINKTIHILLYFATILNNRVSLSVIVYIIPSPSYHNLAQLKCNLKN